MSTRLRVNKAFVGSTYEEAKKELLQDDAFRIEWETRVMAAEMAAEMAALARRMRSEAGLSQAQLAKALHVSQPLIARLESKDPERTPTFETMARIASACRRRMVVSFQKEDTSDDHPLLLAE